VHPSKSELEALTEKSTGQKRALIQVLQDIQDRIHWLPAEALEHVARTLGVPLVQVYGVATFYKSFSLEPRGRHVCTVCLGTACHVRGGQALLEHFERKLGIPAGRTTPDGKFTIERVNCLGACALAPLAVVDGHYYGRMSEAKADSVLAGVLREGDP
jgi:NADH-quinone oxidoreductase subunit E